MPKATPDTITPDDLRPVLYLVRNPNRIDIKAAAAQHGRKWLEEQGILVPAFAPVALAAE